MEECQAPEEGLLAPDLVFYLDISPEVCMLYWSLLIQALGFGYRLITTTIPSQEAAKRGGYGGERYEHLDLHQETFSLVALTGASAKR